MSVKKDRKGSDFNVQLFTNHEDGKNYVAVSKTKYSEEEAKEAAKEYLLNPVPAYTELDNYIRFGIGYDHNHKRVNCYWLCHVSTRPNKAEDVYVFTEGN